jgi:hypothetical protein
MKRKPQVSEMEQWGEFFEVMGNVVEDRAQARAEAEGEELTAELLKPKADISAKAGRMERDAPLFWGKGDNPALF